MKIERSKNDFKSENTWNFYNFRTQAEMCDNATMNCENAERVNMIY